MSSTTPHQPSTDQHRDADAGPPDGRRIPQLDARAAHGVVDRRLGIDRRRGTDRDPISGLERRRGPGRRLSDFQRAADTGEMTAEQFLFLSAIDAFKKANDKPFPTWTDVLEVVRLLGYRKTARSELNLPNCDDWRERPDAPSNVRPDGWERRFRKNETNHDEDDGLDAAIDELLKNDAA